MATLEEGKEEGILSLADSFHVSFSSPCRTVGQVCCKSLLLITRWILLAETINLEDL